MLVSHVNARERQNVMRRCFNVATVQMIVTVSDYDIIRRSCPVDRNRYADVITRINPANVPAAMAADDPPLFQ